ncbi:uncharacterized protein LOC118612929 [Rousettus aegyptiacus]|uniref:uncharacterized protein LOC118612929 n=1 Tax=Rousettus aegyptiacus TaxID=9407 RepID=UPI00168CCFB0|nr:uncharacterized protein LOC118612929 [Rousettus aegyptiacus]
MPQLKLLLALARSGYGDPPPTLAQYQTALEGEAGGEPGASAEGTVELGKEGQWGLGAAGWHREEQKEVRLGLLGPRATDGCAGNGPFRVQECSAWGGATWRGGPREAREASGPHSFLRGGAHTASGSRGSSKRAAGHLRPEVQRVADDAPVGGTQFPGPSSGRSGGSQCPPPRGWRWLWVPCRRQAGTGLPGTCGALCYALVDGLVLKNHAPAAGGSFPPSPAQPGGCHRRAPQTCPGAEGHPLRVGVPRGGAGGARTAVCADLRERGHLLWLLLWASQMSSPGPNGFPFFSRTSQGSGTPWAAQEKTALLPRGLDCGHERKWGELGTEGGGTLPGPAPGSHGG